MYSTAPLINSAQTTDLCGGPQFPSPERFAQMIIDHWRQSRPVEAGGEVRTDTPCSTASTICVPNITADCTTTHPRSARGEVVAHDRGRTNAAPFCDPRGPMIEQLSCRTCKEAQSKHIENLIAEYRHLVDRVQLDVRCMNRLMLDVDSSSPDDVHESYTNIMDDLNIHSEQYLKRLSTRVGMRIPLETLEIDY